MFNVLYGGDRLTLRGIYLSMRSMLEHNHFPIHFFILTMQVNDAGKKGKAIIEKDRLFLETMAKEFNKDNIVELFDYTDRYKSTLEKTRNHKSSFSPYCMLRLYSESILPDDTVLYLDADTLINGDLSEMLDIDVSKIELVAGLDYLGEWWVHPGYFNSGVLLLNGKRIKETHLFERCINLLMEKTFYFADQSALNNLVKDFKYFSRKYNEQRPLKKDTLICHFCNRVWRFWHPIRPWDVKEMREIFKIHNFDNTYKDYLEKFPFKEIGISKPNYKF